MPACDRCHSRKTKCDRQTPRCGSCAAGGVPCQYPAKRNERRLQQDYVKDVERRLALLERENNRLRNQYNPSQVTPRTPHESNVVHDFNHQTGFPSSGSEMPQSHPYELNSLQEQTPENSEGPPALVHSVRPDNQEPSNADTARPQGHYLGASTSADFVDMVESVVDSSPGRGNLFRNITNGHPYLMAESAPLVVKDWSLPSQSTAMPLIRAYFEHWHLTFPILYRMDFMKIVGRIYTEPEYYKMHPGSAFAFEMVLALGSATSKRFEWSFGDTESHFARALTKLDALAEFQDMRSLQALLLCCQYGIHASLRDTSSEMWHLLGKASRLCIELGLHRRATGGLARCDTYLTGPLAPALRPEMQSRCFWCCYNLDRIVCITLGRSLTFHDDDVDAALPSPLRDEELGTGTACSPARQTASPTTSPFIQLIQYRRILAKTHKALYTNVNTGLLPPEEKLAIRRQLLDELQVWRNKIPLLNLPSSNQPASILSSFCHPSWYEALHNNARLLLYRPSAAFPPQESPDREGGEDVLYVIWDSSRAMIARYTEVMRARRLNYSWITLYTIFMAGLANVYSVGRCARRRSQGVAAFLPSYLEVVVVFRDCSNMLTAICERWDDVRSSCEVFNRLSVSALKELTGVMLREPEASSRDHSLGMPGGVGDMGDSWRLMDIANNEVVAERDPTRVQHMQELVDQHRDLIGLDNTMPSSELDDLLDFQQFFQGMQNSVHQSDLSMANEVMLGFGQEWFER